MIKGPTSRSTERRALLTLAKDPRRRAYAVTVIGGDVGDKYVIRAEETVRKPGRGGRIVLRDGAYTAWPKCEIAIQ